MARIRASRVAAALAATLLLAACGGNAAPPPTATRGLPVIDLVAPGGALRAEVARTPDERARGLGGRDGLDEGTGMLFDLESTRPASFWMKDMRFAIDMVWITADHRVAGVTADAQPQPGAADDALRRYASPAPVRYVLELRAGDAAAYGIAAGAALRFDMP